MWRPSRSRAALVTFVDGSPGLRLSDAKGHRDLAGAAVGSRPHEGTHHFPLPKRDDLERPLSGISRLI